jgi:hypothetical protein
MSNEPPRRSMSGMTLTRIFAAVLALDVLGLAVTLISGNEDLIHALVIGTPINAPFTFVAVQALIVLAATRIARAPRCSPCSASSASSRVSSTARTRPIGLDADPDRRGDRRTSARSWR